jgi:hypothetical protein
MSDDDSVTSGELYQYCTPQTLKDHKPCQMMIVLLQVSYTSTVHISSVTVQCVGTVQGPSC